MRYLGLILLIAISSKSYVQGQNCDKLFQKTIQQDKMDDFEKCEKHYLLTLYVLNTTDYIGIYILVSLQVFIKRNISRLLCI